MEKITDHRKTKVVIVGAGVGGVATAARLAHAGFDVEVYEKNDYSGGRCSLIHHDGYRFDQGPSLLLLPPLFHQIYRDLGTTLEEHLHLYKCDPNYVVWYHDGEKVVLSTDRAQLRAEVEKYEGKGGGDRLEAFLHEAGIHADLSYDLVLSKTFPSYLSLLRPSFLKNALILHPLESLWTRSNKFFKTERMRRAFSFSSMYLGMSPMDAPATYSLLQWSETVEGIWYPRGGFHQVVQSLINIAETHGAKFHFGSPISHVSVDESKGKADGIYLEGKAEKSGGKVDADVVVVNADLAYAYANLFRDRTGKADTMRQPAKAKSMKDKPHSCSSISFYWAMDRQIEGLKAHNIFLAEDYEDSFDDIFKRSTMPKEPSFYVNVPSKVDPSAAPEGKDTIVVLVPVGHMLLESEAQDWDALVRRAKEQILTMVEKRIGINLRDHIIWESVNTPETWRDKFNLTHGSILGVSHDFFNVLSFRHQARHPKLKDTYFVGASAHPGTGVPIALAGSRLATQTILENFGMSEPESYRPIERNPSTMLDHKIPPSFRLKYEGLVPAVLYCLAGVAATCAWVMLTGRLSSGYGIGV